MIRVGGRLEFAENAQEEKNQVIIPHHDELVEKLVGIATREAKIILKMRLFCKHCKTKPLQQMISPLSAERVLVVPANIGLDFMGLLYLKKMVSTGKSETTKAHVCIFMCEES